MTSFAYLRCGRTPELTSLGNRIADCIVRHGYSEKDWLLACIRRQIETIGVERLYIALSSVDGIWSVGDWRPA